MKYFVALIAIAHMIICGCVSIKYQGVEYFRMGDQHVKQFRIFHVHADGSSTEVMFESQDSEATALNSAINLLGGLAK
jgi:hypothetical protein